MKTTLAAAVVVGIWLAPTAYAAPQDQPFLSFLAAHQVAVDTNTAINAAHIACAQIADGEPLSTVAAIVSQQFPTISGDEYWITAGARQAYCPN
ncbi:MAG: DUF732 domain-containing protein [Mycobacterium sp.]|uniref:DUF732 domain-containing protein n=1 Tax=Mycobacterium sp. TaxID=1785 RepID=UPI003C6A2082